MSQLQYAIAAEAIRTFDQDLGTVRAQATRRLICLATLARLLGDHRRHVTLSEWRRATGLTPLLFEHTVRQLEASRAVSYTDPADADWGYDESLTVTIGGVS